MPSVPRVHRIASAYEPAYEPLPGATGMELSRVISVTGESDLGGGFARFTQDGEFADWTLSYDEVIYVLEGHLRVESINATQEGATGDVILIEKGATVTYRADAGTRILFVLSPRKWAESESNARG